ncbi:MAG: methyltransferase domain-containing protein [Geminicoccaceae bacterium]
MSEGFTSDWLTLREGYDGRARSVSLLAQLAAWRAGRGPLDVIDLGAGTGSNLRAVAPRLGGAQRWTLAEHDPALIDAGRVKLAKCSVPWNYRRTDLAADLQQLAGMSVDLITASALLDLVAEPWLARLAAWRRRTGAALYMVLTYNGRCAWEPREPFDDAALDLVDRHQRIDKGFGPALGPGAASCLRGLLGEADGTLVSGPSDWVLQPSDRRVQEELLSGYARSAAEMAPSLAPEIADWVRRRRSLIAADASWLAIGHEDLLLLPGG